MIVDFDATLRAAQSGDDAAVGVLWEELNHRLVRFLRAREFDAAEDIASETWLTVASKLGQFRGSEVEFRAWLFTIARSRLVDWQRRRRRRPEALITNDELPEELAPLDTEGAALAALDREAALRMIASLPSDQGDVILLRLLADLDVAQVAKIMGKRQGAVRMLQLRGLRTLEQLMHAADHAARRVTR
jgi:RNA polymerase sigma-70 factor (ECF subfamily)